MYEHFKRETLITILAVGMAFSIFVNFETFLKMCSWLSPFIEKWREFTYTFWDFVFSWLPFSFPNTLKNLFSTLALGALVFIRAQTLSTSMVRSEGIASARDYITQPLPAFLFKTRTFSTLVISLFIAAPIFSFDLRVGSEFLTIRQALDSIFSIALVIIKILFIVALVVVVRGPSTEDILPRLERMFMSSGFWRAITIVVCLFVINAIGILYESHQHRSNSETSVELLELSNKRVQV